MAKFITPNGKDVSSYVTPNTALWAVKFNQGGELPQQLSGTFTSERLADVAINQYILTAAPAKQDKAK